MGSYSISLPGRICRQKLACDLMPHPVAANLNIASSSFCLGRAKKQHDSNSRLVSDDYDTMHQERWLPVGHGRRPNRLQCRTLSWEKAASSATRESARGCGKPSFMFCCIIHCPLANKPFQCQSGLPSFESVAISPSNTVCFNPC